MKRVLMVSFLIGSLSTDSCKKDNTHTNLSLIEHQWNIVSITGEALYYAGKTGDYYNFDPNGMLFISEGGKKDTAIYSLGNQGQTLVLYSIVNGSKLDPPSNYDIAVLTNSQLILHNQQVRSLGIDSLSR
jgi:hypothetical protein